MSDAESVMDKLHRAWNVGDCRAFDAILANRDRLPGPNETDANGRTALWLAAAIGSSKAIDLFLSAGANPEFHCPATGYTALHAATFWRHVDAARMLLEKHSDPDARDQHGQTPLMLAILGGNFDHTLLFLEFRANVDLQDNNGMTALMMAVARRRTAFVQQLLSAHAHVNVQDENGSTALMLAANVQIFRLLLESGASVVLRDKDGKTVHERMANRPQLLALLPSHTNPENSER